MKFTTVHINALIALIIMMGLAGGIIFLVIQENGQMSDTRFLHCIALLGAVVWGVRAVAMSFAGTPGSCPKCGADLTTDGEKP